MEPSFNLIMNLNYIFLTNISYLTILKIIFILFLLFLNIVLIIYIELPHSEKIKQSGFFGKNSSLLTNTIGFFSGSAGLYASYLTIKAEHIHQKKINELTKKNQELQEDCAEAKEEIKNLKGVNDQTKNDYLNLVNKAQENNNRQISYITKKSKIETEIAELEECRKNSVVLSEVKKYEEKIAEKKLMKKNLDQEQDDEIIKNHTEWNSIIGNDKNNRSNLLDLNYNFNDFLENFSLIEKISLCFLLLNQIILSSIISIFFLIYGDYLIKKFNLETRYPKLAKLIQYRRKFSNYYMYLNISLIIGVFLVENIFLISILLLKLD